MHTELEECVADFVGKPSALVFGMGYVTNSAILPVLIGKVMAVTWAIILCSFIIILNVSIFAGRVDYQ